MKTFFSKTLPKFFENGEPYICSIKCRQTGNTEIWLKRKNQSVKDYEQLEQSAIALKDEAVNTFNKMDEAERFEAAGYLITTVVTLLSGGKKAATKLMSKYSKATEAVAEAENVAKVTKAATEAEELAKAATDAAKVATEAEELAKAGEVAKVTEGLEASQKAGKVISKGTQTLEEAGKVEEVAGDVAKVTDGIDIGIKSIPKTIKNVEAPVLPEGSQWERNVLNSFAEGKSNPVTYEGGKVLYRVGGKNGAFWSLDYPPATEYQWRVDAAIKQEFCNDASTLYKMEIPQGSSLSGIEGKVGSQGMGLYGGAHQVYIDYRAVPEDWIETSKMIWK